MDQSIIYQVSDRVPPTLGDLLAIKKNLWIAFTFMKWKKLLTMRQILAEPKTLGDFFLSS